jgi:hypothetical protein
LRFSLKEEFVISIPTNVLSEKLQKELVNITKKGDIVEAIKELITRELVRKKNKYTFMVSNFEKKYHMKLKNFKKVLKDQKMDYELEKDYFDWDMAVTVLEDIEEEMKEME